MPKSESFEKPFEKISYWVEYKFTNEQLNFEKGIEDFLNLKSAIKFVKELQKTYEIYGPIGYDIYKKECITTSEIELEIENDSIVQRKQNIESLMTSLAVQYQNLCRFKDEYGVTKPEVNLIQSRYQYLLKISEYFNTETGRNKSKSSKLCKPLHLQGYKCSCNQLDCIICNYGNSASDEDSRF